jgi:hypothetical protein
MFCNSDIKPYEKELNDRFRKSFYKWLNIYK